MGGIVPDPNLLLFTTLHYDTMLCMMGHASWTSTTFLFMCALRMCTMVLDKLRDMIPFRRSWMSYESGLYGWEEVGTHRAYSIEQNDSDGVVLHLYQVIEYEHPDREGTRFAGFRSNINGTVRFDDINDIKGVLGQTIELYIAGKVQVEYLPLDSFDGVVIT